MAEVNLAERQRPARSSSDVRALVVAPGRINKINKMQYEVCARGYTRGRVHRRYAGVRTGYIYIYLFIYIYRVMPAHLVAAPHRRYTLNTGICHVAPSVKRDHNNNGSRHKNRRTTCQRALKVKL